MIRINLLPVRTSKKRETAYRQLVFAGVGLGIIGAGIFAVHMSVAASIDTAEKKNKQLDEEIARLKQVIGQVEEFEKKKEELQKKLDIIKTLKGRKTGPVHMLDEIAMNIPEKCWLTSVAELNKKVTVQGMAINNEVIADFISELSRSPYFEDVYLVSTKQTAKKGGIKLKEFSLTARMTTPDQKKALPDDTGEEIEAEDE